jgi:hypothetical protein
MFEILERSERMSAANVFFPFNMPPAGNIIRVCGAN